MGPQLKVVEKTRTATMLCAASGNPDPEISWFKDFLPVDVASSNGRIKQLRSGIISHTFSLTALSLPKPPTAPVVTETTATSVTLTWDSGNPDPISYYVIQYKAKSSERGYQEADGVATTRYSIGGLSPYSEYEFRVIAVNNIGRGPPSNLVDARTGEQAPSSPPLRVQARMLSASTILVQWEPPEESNGQIRGYRVYYSDDLQRPLSSWNKHNTDDSRLTTVSNLITGTTYSIRVLGFTSVGDGPPSDVLQVKAQQGVPAQPSNFQAEAESDTRIMLTWLLPTQERIIKYELEYWEEGSDKKQRLNLNPADSYAVEGLKPDTMYKFTLAAHSDFGVGVYTQPIEARTAQSTPSAPPQEVHAVSLSSTSIKVSWVAPPAGSRHGAIVQYTVAYQAVNGEDSEKHEVSSISAEATSYVMEALEKWTEYMVWVRAHTDVGPGPESPPVHVRTDEDVPSAPPRKVEAEAINSTAIRVTWKAPLSNKQHGQIRGYQVTYSRLENSEPRGQPLIKDIMLPEAQEAVITGLLSETTYSITIAAYTTKGDGARSKAKVISTMGAVPGKPTMMISPTMLNTALIQWQPPKDMVGELIGYQLQYKRVEEETYRVVDLKKNDDHYTVTGLHKGATYIFKLSAKNRAGNGEQYAKEITTTEDTPSGFPQKLRVVGLTTSTTELAWEPPLLAERNGKIVQYTVVYRDINSLQNHTNVTFETHIVLSNLQPDTTYDIRVRSFTSKGPGPISPSIQSRTMPVEQVFAKSFRVKAVMKTSVLLTWEVPESYKSQVPFKILYNGQSVEVQGNLKRKMITKLQPDTEYSFALMSRGNNAGGLQQVVSIRTAPDLLKTKPVLFSKSEEGDGKLTINLPKVQTNVPVRWYYIVVLPVTQATSRKWENPDELELDNLLEASENPRRHSRQTEVLKPYIAAKLDSLPDTFTLGDEKYYNGFYNKLLPGEQKYLCFVLAALEDKNTKTFAASPYSDPIQVKVSPDMAKQQEDPEMLWVMGPVLAVILIIMIVIAILLFKRKRASPSAKDDHSGGVKDSLLAHSTDPVEMRRLNYQTPENVPPRRQKMTTLVELRTLCWPTLQTLWRCDASITRLQIYSRGIVQYKCIVCQCYKLGYQVYWLHFWNAVIAVQWGVVHQKQAMASYCMREHPPISVTELADHIESLKANDGLRFSQEYESVDPGQQFTWENSNLEVNKPKNRYANVISYDHSRVILTSIDGKYTQFCNSPEDSSCVPGSDYINANYIDGYRKQNAYIATQGPLPETLSDFWRMVWEQRTNTIVMMTRLEEKSRVKCDQYWPSRGTETYGMIQVTMLDTVELATYSVRTFALYKNGSSEKRELRQFQFMAWPDHGVPEYPTPILAFLRRVKACNPTDAGPMVVHCSAGVGRTGCLIVIEAMLERMKHEKSVDIYGHVTCMRSQRNYMVQTEDQYIFIHEALLEAAICGNTEVPARNLYAHIQKLTQVPPGDTVTSMELEFKRLANSKAHTSRFISANLPCNKFKNRLVNIMPFESTRVCLQPIRGVEGSDYINASFIDGYRYTAHAMLGSKGFRDGQSRTIRQFQFTDWPEQGVPKTGEGFIDFIGQVHKTKEQFGQDGPITVHCSAGVGRTGVFITLSIVLERMRYEGVVDLFQTVKALRTQRPAMVQTEDQYQLCYRAALEYLGSFDHYAT
ncbi:UNVERIFIED_CONTAM: hypothetical protein FKN15_040223 [Acipenser sinensis]